MKKSCGIFTNIAPIYSKPLWYELASSEKVDYFFYSSRSGFSGIKTIDINESEFYNSNGKLKWHFLKNIYIKDILVFQTGIISKCIFSSYDAYIFNGEMQCLSTWIASLACKIRKKPVLFWSHGIYGNETRIKRTIRVLFFEIADYHLIYGKRSRDRMINSGFSSKNIYIVYNSLDYNRHRKLYEKRNKTEIDLMKSKLFPLNPGLPVIVFIGRLTKEKKLSYLLEAVNISRTKGILVNCLIIGTGRELQKLQLEAISLKLQKNVNFYGACYDEWTNSQLIMMAECCVSPGNVGLTAIHSMSLGTPVITHDNFSNQNPEVEAVIHNQTGLFFKENNIESLSNAINKIIINKKKSLMEDKCLGQISKFWNPINQRLVFDNAVLKSVTEKYDQ